jgi:hypothetical protein
MEPETGPVTRGKSRRTEITVLPEANPNWLPQARSWYNSLRLSGQSDFYEASDWMMAVIAAQAFDTFLRTYNASILASFVRISERLGVTYSDRTRAGIVLADPAPRDADEDAADAAVIDWQKRLGRKLHAVEDARPDPSPAGPKARVRRS